MVVTAMMMMMMALCLPTYYGPVVVLRTWVHCCLVIVAIL